MRVCLINAPYNGPVAGIWSNVFPPLPVLYLAAYLRQKRPAVSVSVVDALRLGFRKGLEAAAGQQADLYCVSFLTFNATTAYEFINILKSLCPGAVIAAGGTHVTSLEQDAFSKSNIDYAIHGEGEQTLVELADLVLRQSDPSKISGLIYREDGELVRTPDRPLIENLDDLPFPARDLVPMNRYSGLYICRHKENTHLLTGRGCVNHCTFCARRVWKRQSPKLRLRSPENIVAEAAELKEQYGIREFFDMGDEFNSSEDWATRTSNALADADMGLVWQAFSRAAPVTDKMARAMRESDCWLVHLGIESGNQRSLDGIRKNITLEQARDAAATYQRNGIKVVGLFMLFHAWEEDGRLVYETETEAKNTLTFARRMLKDKLVNSITCSPALPYPGSILYDVATRHKLIPKDRFLDWGLWDHSWGTVMELPGVSPGAYRRVKMSGVWTQSRALLFSGHLNFSRAIWSRGFGALKMLMGSAFDGVKRLSGFGRKGITP